MSTWWKNFFGTQRRRLNCYISYRRVDGFEYAKALARALREQGVDTWLDQRQLVGGDSLIETTREAASRADAFIVIWTPTALHSEWVRFELAIAKSTGRLIIPVMFEGMISRSDVPPELAMLHWAIEPASALTEGPTPETLTRILKSLEHVERTVSPPVPARKPAEVRPLNEGKLILVGRGEVGKTSLVRRLVDDTFRGDESKTQGINITNWPLQGTDATFRLNVWDFGGQEIMHATHQFFLTERSLYLLVLNGREGGEDLDAEYWFKHIESFGGSSPVIVVQNKIDQHPFDLNYRGLRARYPQIQGFVKTDCSKNIGLSELRAMIQHVVEAMPEVRMKFPADWFAVKEHLESMDAEFMGYEEFRRLCDDDGISSETDRDTLASVLHCLGIALNYRDDSRLRETSVLKPEWVTQGIYRILNASVLAARQGELHLDDLREILPAQRYPAEKHLFLLELMRKFSLCFAFSEQADRFLVPDLLGKEEPEEAHAFAPAECLNFEYHYGVLPEGLIPRFIVRSHTLSQGQPRWRSGVILTQNDCNALVMSVPADRRVIVRVKHGNAGTRRDLLAVIRYDLDRINAEFKDRLDAQPKVPLSGNPAFAIDYQKLVAFEEQGVDTFPEFVGRDVVTVHVRELLNGVDLQEQRQSSLAALAQAKSVFFSYSHKDELLRDQLETHLKLLQRLGVISTWHDRKIPAGKEWDGEIDVNLERAKIILLLVSANFLASDYCWGKEVELAMQRHASREAVVIPIMVRPCDWKGAPFEKLEGLPKDMKPVTSFRNRDAAWTAVATGIRSIAETLH